jgi:hypothetical protein
MKDKFEKILCFLCLFYALISLVYRVTFKGGVDTLDQMIAIFSCKRRTLRWPMNCLFYMLDVAAYNSFALHFIKTNGNENFINRSKRLRRESLEIIALALINPLIESSNLEMSKVNYKHTKTAIIDSIEKAGFCSFKNLDLTSPLNRIKGQISGRCLLCSEAKLKTHTSINCKNRNIWVCSNHLKRLCENCHQ